MGRPLVVASLVLIVGATPAACALFVDTGGLSGDDRSSTVPPRSGLLDGGTTTDARSLADAPMTTPSWCQTRPGHTFCEDFDTKPLGTDWTSIIQLAGPLAFDTVAHRSPPRSLEVSATGTEGSVLGKRLAGTSRFVLAADVRLDEADGTNVDFLTLSFDANNVSLAYLTFMSDGQRGFEYGFEPDPGGRSGVKPITFAIGEWHRVEIEADLAARQAVLRVDGSALVTITIPAMNVSAALAEVGINHGDTDTRWGAHFDNVIVDAR